MDALAENRNRYRALGLTLLFHAVACLVCMMVVFTSPVSSFEIQAPAETYPGVECFAINEIENTSVTKEHHSQITNQSVVSPPASEKIITDESGEQVNLLKEILRRKVEKQNQAIAPPQSSTGIETGNDGGVAVKGGGEYYMKDRQLTEKPLLYQDAGKEGIVVVEILVDENGNVMRAIPGQRGSTTTDESLYQEAQKAAMRAKFNALPGVKEQRGTYTFVFTLE